MAAESGSATLERTEGERIAEGAWDGSPGRFTDQQYQSSCVLDRRSCGGDWASKPPKTRCSLPIHEPGGELSRAGTHAAAARIGQVTNACSGAMASAKAKLRSAYKQLGEDPPPSLKQSANSAELPPLHRDRALATSEGEWVFREEAKGGTLGVLTGHFAVFNRWTEINSFFEGNFLERLAPGSFTKTFEDNRKGMRALFQHGKDPSIGLKTLGPIRDLEQDEFGARYEVDLLDTSYNRDLLPGLQSNQYGASFRFQVMREEVVQNPERSDHNPQGIPECTLQEVKVREFGPVTFGAYEDATAGMRSLNDELIGMDLRLLAASDPQQVARFATILTGSTISAIDPSANVGTREEEIPPEEAPEVPPEAPEEPTEAPEEPEAEPSEESAEQEASASSHNAPVSRAPDVKRKLYGSTLVKRAAPLRTNRKIEEPEWKLVRNSSGAVR